MKRYTLKNGIIKAVLYTGNLEEIKKDPVIDEMIKTNKLCTVFITCSGTKEAEGEYLAEVLNGKISIILPNSYIVLERDGWTEEEIKIKVVSKERFERSFELID